VLQGFADITLVVPVAVALGGVEIVDAMEMSDTSNPVRPRVR